MVDPERLRRLLHLASERISRLRRDAELDRDEILTDEMRSLALERVFQTAIEACIDAAQHVCSSEGWGPPKDNADAMRVLRDHDVLDRELAEVMGDAVRFRNVLVHLYAEVDLDKVIDHLGSLDELDRFVASVAELIE